MILHSGKTGIVINDLHYPFADHKVINLVLGFAKEMQPDYFVLNGDLLDMYEISDFERDPTRKFTVKTEIDIGREFLQRVRDELPAAELHFVLGNHEYRFDRFIWRNAKQLADLDNFNLPAQLKIKEYGWQQHYRWNKESYMNMGKFLIGHFAKVSQQSAYTAKNLLDRYGKSLIQGHVHRGGVHYRRFGDVLLQAVENFCLCNLEPEWTILPNWQHGFTIFRMTKKAYDFEAVLIDNYMCRYFG